MEKIVISLEGKHFLTTSGGKLNTEKCKYLLAVKFIMPVSETNTHSENKRAYDNFRKKIEQHWKGIAITTSETNLSWD